MKRLLIVTMAVACLTVPTFAKKPKKCKKPDVSIDMVEFAKKVYSCGLIEGAFAVTTDQQKATPEFEKLKMMDELSDCAAVRKLIEKRQRNEYLVTFTLLPSR